MTKCKIPIWICCDFCFSCNSKKERPGCLFSFQQNNKNNIIVFNFILEIWHYNFFHAFITQSSDVYWVVVNCEQKLKQRNLLFGILFLVTGWFNVTNIYTNDLRHANNQFRVMKQLLIFYSPKIQDWLLGCHEQDITK